jgi:hypothetical protein
MTMTTNVWRRGKTEVSKWLGAFAYGLFVGCIATTFAVWLALVLSVLAAGLSVLADRSGLLDE